MKINAAQASLKKRQTILPKNNKPFLQRPAMIMLIIAGIFYLILSLAICHYFSAHEIFDLSVLKLSIGVRLGLRLGHALIYCFGYSSYAATLLAAYFLLIHAKNLLKKSSTQAITGKQQLGGGLLLLSCTCLSELLLPQHESWINFSSGGLLGFEISHLFLSVLPLGICYLIFYLLALWSTTLIAKTTPLQLLEHVGRRTQALWQAVRVRFETIKSQQQLREEALLQAQQQRKNRARLQTRDRIEPQISATKSAVSLADPFEPTFGELEMPGEFKTPELNQNATRSARPNIQIHQPKPEEISLDDEPVYIPSSRRNSNSSLPSLTLLDMPKQIVKNQLSWDMLEHLSREVEARMKEFGIAVQVVAVHPGPVVTRFELELAPGMKVSRISSLAKDLARSLSVISVRIVEVIPGKSVIGLELPNEQRETVRLREVIASTAYQQAASPLSLVLGKDIAGHTVVVDLAKMPHLLVAGTTGSGKSVGLNAMLLSLLFKATPEQVRLILIDPKMLELSVYDGIMHLLTPVVTDMKEAAHALKWCVTEMDRRYRLMATLGVRNLAGYNTKISEANAKGQPIPDPFWQRQTGDMTQEPATLETLPYVVVVIDELADMMMIVGKKVEELIARIAQKARAAGIHLILATQRPSVDVITGLIKANIPTRIAFQVSSKIDSRTILDQQGAEQLLGHGDMLYLAPGTGVPIRVHGAFVDDSEVHRVVHELKHQGEPDYIASITSGDFAGSESLQGLDLGEGGEQSDVENDPLYDQAVAIVIESKRASISHLQRRLKIGYNRAARLVDKMEEVGLVGPMEHNGNREVLVGKN